MDQFFQEIYAPIIFKWLSYKNDNNDGIKVHTVYNNELYQTITFTLNKYKGTMTLWHIGVIEEEIKDMHLNKNVFYLHYRFINIPHFMKMYNEFYRALLKYSTKSKIHIGIVCSGAFTATSFSHLLNKSINLTTLPFEIKPYAYYELKNTQDKIDVIFLAPQIAHFHVKMITNYNIPIYIIDPLIYATKDTHKFITLLEKQCLHIKS